MISERYKTVANMCTMSDSSLDYGNPPQRIFMSCSWSHGNDQWYVDLCDISRYWSLVQVWILAEINRYDQVELYNSCKYSSLGQVWIFARVDPDLNICKSCKYSSLDQVWITANLNRYTRVELYKSCKYSSPVQIWFLVL